MDDAFVYFRYADNLLFLNLGLVYNQGEFVEGFSSPLWMLLLTGLRATGANWWLIVRGIGLLSFGLVWIAALVAHRRLSDFDEDASQARRRFLRLRPLNLPLVFLSLHYGISTSFTSGLETPLVQVMGAAFALLLLFPRSRALRIVVGFAPLVRPELVLATLLVLGWLGWRERRVPWSLAGALVIPLAVWMVFRIWYYADLFPNTYYLKNDVWVAQGLRYFWDTVRTYHLYAWAGLSAVGWLGLQRRNAGRLESWERAMMLLLGMPTVLYTIRIGGDFLHYRYLAFPMILGVFATCGLFERATQQLLVSSRLATFRDAGLALLSGVAVFWMYPGILAGHPYSMPDQVRDGDEAIIEDAMAHRKRPELQRDPWGSGNQYEQKSRYEEFLRSAGRYRFEQMAADFWCVRNYEHFNWYALQSLGLCDPILSRMNVESQRPGHHWDLHPLGQQIVLVRAEFGLEPQAFARAIRAGKAPDWAVANKASIALIEQKAYNRHEFGENLRLAFRFPERIDLVSPPPPLKTRRGRRLGSGDSP
jgi:hypothetical protein